MAYSVRSTRINGLVAVRLFTRFVRRQLQEKHGDVQELDEISLGYRGNNTAESISDSTWYGPQAPVLSAIDRVVAGEAMERLLNVRLVKPARMSTWMSSNAFAIRSRAGWRLARPNAVPVGHTQQMGQRHKSIPRLTSKAQVALTSKAQVAGKHPS